MLNENEKKTNKLQPFFVVRRAQAVAVHIDHRYSNRVGRLKIELRYYFKQNKVHIRCLF